MKRQPNKEDYFTKTKTKDAELAIKHEECIKSLPLWFPLVTSRPDFLNGHIVNYKSYFASSIIISVKSRKIARKYNILVKHGGEAVIPPALFLVCDYNVNNNNLYNVN